MNSEEPQTALIEYPPSPARAATVDGGGVAEFFELFKRLRSRWVKVEYLQHYDESGSEAYSAFQHEDYSLAQQLVRESVKSQTEVYSLAREHSVKMQRIRVYDAPLSPYLRHYELAAYEADIECGEEIFFIDRPAADSILGNSAVSDFVLWDDFAVLGLIYDVEAGRLRKAVISENPATIEAYTVAVQGLLESALPMFESPIYQAAKAE